MKLHHLVIGSFAPLLLAGGCSLSAGLPSIGGRISAGPGFSGPSGGETYASEGGGAGASYADGPACVPDRAGSTFKSALPIGQGVHRGCVAQGPDTDIYAVTAPADAPAGVLYEFRLATGEHQICATILDQDRQQHGGGECVEGGKQGAFWAAIAPGTTLYVRLERSLSYATGYELRVRESVLDDPSEPNNSWKAATKLALGEAHTGLMHMVLNDDDQHIGKDFYKVKVRRAGKLSIVIDPQSDDVQPEVYLHDADRSTIERVNAQNAGAVLRADVEVEAGTYYLVVQENSSTVYPYGISSNGDEKPASHYSTPYELRVDLDDGGKGKKKRISRR